MVISDYITPVMYVDPSGESFFAILGSLAIGTIVGGIIGAVTAALEGENVIAGLASGAISGVVLTAGIALAVVSGGLGGVAISATFGFAAGFGGDLIDQGISDGWGNLDLVHATIIGGVSVAFSVITFGFTNFISRNSVGVFEKIFDKTLSVASRFGHSLGISTASVIVTGLIAWPLSVATVQGIRIADLFYDSSNLRETDIYAGA